MYCKFWRIKFVVSSSVRLFKCLAREAVVAFGVANCWSFWCGKLLELFVWQTVGVFGVETFWSLLDVFICSEMKPTTLEAYLKRTPTNGLLVLRLAMAKPAFTRINAIAVDCINH